MASLARLGRSFGPKHLSWSCLLVKRAQVAAPLVSKAHVGYWNKDWRPGPYPETEKERLAAAKKYGMRPEDYQPYPDDGTGFGDYPCLPRVGDASKCDYEVYDIPEMKRNYGEVVHYDADVLKEAYENPTQQYRVSWAYMYTFFFGIMGTLAFFMFLVDGHKAHPPALPKQYPTPDVKHYLFEPAD